MKGSLTVVIVFVLGIAVGYWGACPNWLSNGSLTMPVLYLLIIEIGLALGMRPGMKEKLSSVSLKYLLLPLCTAAGTLGLTVAAGLWMGRWSLADYLAIGSGFGYYSLSSVIIIEGKELQYSTALAAELGALALVTNILREMFTLMFAPLMVKAAGKLAPITSSGVTSLDVSLPVIARCCGAEMIPVALVHGLVLEVSVPVLVSLFCSL